MRLIDADEIHDLTKVFSDKENGNAHFIYGIETAVEFADGLPTVDAALVRHGNWIPCDGDKSRGQYYTFKCSCCEKYTILAKMERYCDYNYCPYCSARMVTDDV